MPEILVQRPVGDPIDLIEAKLHLRVSEASQDAVIRAMLAGSCRLAEMKTRNQLLHARWKLVLDNFPMAGIGTPLPFAESVNIPAFAVMLPHAPVTDIVSVKYLDMNGVQQTMPSTEYVLNKAMTPALLAPGFGKIWPIALPQIGAVEITYNAGYASPFALNAAAPTGQIKVTGPVSYAVGDTVEFYNSGGALPAGLTAGTPYLIATAPGNGVYTLTTMAGGAVSLTDAGSASNFIGLVPEGIRNWIMLRLGALHENREDVAVMSRAALIELPFMESLLDPFRASLP